MRGATRVDHSEGGFAPLPNLPPRTHCEPQDVAGLGTRRPRRASRSLRRRSRRSNRVDQVARGFLRLVVVYPWWPWYSEGGFAPLPNLPPDRLRRQSRRSNGVYHVARGRLPTGAQSLPPEAVPAADTLGQLLP